MQYAVQIVLSARSLETFNLIILYTFSMCKLVNIPEMRLKCEQCVVLQVISFRSLYLIVKV